MWQDLCGNGNEEEGLPALNPFAVSWLKLPARASSGRTMTDSTSGWAKVVECSQIRQDVGGDMKAAKLRGGGWEPAPYSPVMEFNPSSKQACATGNYRRPGLARKAACLPATPQEGWAPNLTHKPFISVRPPQPSESLLILTFFKRWIRQISSGKLINI